MPDVDFYAEELAALLGETSTPPADDVLAALVDSASSVSVASLAQAVAVIPSTAVSGPADVAERPALDHGDYAWNAALPLVPGFEKLLARYPAVGLRLHPEHGVVLLAAYLEDISRGIRRNLKLGDHLFFHAPEIELIEPDTKALGCRLIIKMVRHQVGMRIRFWENARGGDVVGKSGTLVVTARDVVPLGSSRGRAP